MQQEGNPPRAAAPAVVRYQVSDVERSLDFYTRRLGFQLEQRAGAVFASVTRGSLRLLLSGPGSSGSRPLPDGRRQEPGGSNRFVLFIDDLDAHIRALAGAGVRFRNQVEVGPGGKQILIEDPDGNPIELHEGPRDLSPAPLRRARPD
jgi:catechol 2,3-dioxygenase-like lactoylglutathione lyase family enzyme